MLNIEKLTNRYEPAAVDGLGVEAGPGPGTGFLGRNGTGKAATGQFSTPGDRPGGRGPKRGWFAWLGRGVTAYPGMVAFGWLLVVAGLLGVSSLLGQPAPSPAESAQLPAGYESARAQAALDRAFGAPSSDATAVLVFSRADGRPLARGNLAAAGHVVAVLARFEARRRAAAPVQSPEPPAAVRSTPVVPSPNHLIAVAQFSFGAQVGTPATSQAVVNIRAGIGRAVAGTGLRADLTGQAAADQDNAGTEQLAMYGMLAAIVVLLLVLFRSPGLPFLVIGAIFGVGEGVTALLNIAGHVLGFQPDQTTTNLLPVVLFGVGTDYAVFLLWRYRDRLRAGEDHATAMAAAVGKVGHAMVASALAVAVSFAAMLASGLATFRILGPSLAVAVLAMLATSVTLLPAVLAVGSKRRARSSRWTRPSRSRATGAAAGLVARRPVPVALGAAAVLAALAVCTLGYHASYDQQPFPAGSQSAVGYHQLQRGFPAGALEPTQVIVTTHGAAPTTAQLARFAAELAKVPGVGRVTPGRTAEQGRVTELDLQLSVNPVSGAAFRTVRAVEAVAATRAPAGTTALVGGDTAAWNDVNTVLGHDMKIIFPLAGIGILMILLLTLGALLASLYLMASVLAAFAASLGATVLVFQGILGHQGVSFQVPIIVYLFVASIGTDYNILTISRLREEMQQGAAPDDAARTAVRRAGPAVAAAGLVLAASFALLAISPLLADIGFAVATGVLICAFTNAFLLIPALTTIAGKAAWWPSHPGAGRHSATTSPGTPPPIQAAHVPTPAR
jgi:RND superfamily putative drug exporter